MSWRCFNKQRMERFQEQPRPHVRSGREETTINVQGNHGGADYTINELRDATYKHVCTHLLFRKVARIEGTMQAVHKKYVQLDNKQVYTMSDQDVLTDE